MNNNKLVNEKLICAFRWSVLPSIMKMQGPKNKKEKQYVYCETGNVFVTVLTDFMRLRTNAARVMGFLLPHTKH